VPDRTPIRRPRRRRPGRGRRGTCTPTDGQRTRRARARLHLRPAGPPRYANSLANAWGDYDNDGDLDLAVSLGSGEVRLYRNDAGTLVSVGAELGMPQAGGQEFRGLSWGDYDGDGFIDLLGGATAKEAVTGVLRNEGGTRFRDVAAEIGLTIPNRSARQTNFLDYDNDGDLDLSVMSYEGPPGAQSPLNALFRNDGAWGFVNVLTKESPLNKGDHGVQWVDYDNDGAVDLTLTDGYGPVGGHLLPERPAR
jgi:hypothetical protein